MNEITEMVQLRNIAQKILDDEIFKICDILKHEYDLFDYLKNVQFTSIPENTMAYFCISQKTIYINYNIMIFSLAKIVKKMKTQDYQLNVTLINNFILKILLHEFEHVIQYKKTYEQKDLENEILIKSQELENKLKKIDNYNFEIYKLNPIERSAECSALYKMINSYIDGKDSLIYNIFLKEYQKISLQNYKIENMNHIITPINQFFDIDHNYHTFNKRLDYIDITDYNYEFRNSYGLKKHLFELK